MQGVGIADRIADIPNGKSGEFEQLRCFQHAIAQKKFLRRFSDCIFEDFPEIAAIQSADIGNIFYCNIVLEVMFDIVEGFVNIEIP